MSTPASQALSGSTPAAEAAPVAAPSPVSPSAPASNQPFWDSWSAPDQKETRDWVANKNYADPFTLAKTAQGLEKDAAALRAAVNLKAYPADKVNPDGTTIKANDNDVKAWNTTMGVPETPDKYDITVPSNTPYPQFTDFLKQAMHESGVPAAMAPRLAAGYEAAVQKLEAQVREQENTQSQMKLAELQRAWGPQYQERIALAARGKDWLSNEVGGLNDGQMRTLEAVLGTDKFMTAMWKFGSGNKEPSFVANNAGQPQGFGNTAASAQERLNQATADRASGKITKDEFLKIQDEVIPTIVNGMAPNPKFG